jgi:hypothetical protein
LLQGGQGGLHGRNRPYDLGAAAFQSSYNVHRDQIVVPGVVKLLVGFSIERVRQRARSVPDLAPAVSFDGNADSTLFDPVQQQAGIAVDSLDAARASKMRRPGAAA